MKKIIVLALLLLSFSLISRAQEFENGDCPFANNSGYVIDCGFVAVPADHANPEGATIQLAVAVVRSNNPDKVAEPVLFLEGGPGGVSVEYAPIISLHNPFLGLVLQNHDVILVDQRGMGYSQPVLFCTPFRSVDDAFAADFTGLFMERMPACLDDFAAQGINWRLFTTEQNALDLAMVGAALGYEKVNLYGRSYGTLLGLIILREHPEVVNSAILDSVLTPQALPFENSAADFDASFAQLETYCAADLACKLAYPNLRQTFLDTYERLKNKPDTLEVDGQSIPVTAGFLTSRVRYMLASAETARLVPAFIVGMANQDYDVVRDFVDAVLSAEVAELPNQALFITMACPLGANSLAAIEAASSTYAEPFQAGGYSPADFQRCQAWGDILPMNRAMPQTDVPVLLLSGELDPLTPPNWAAEAATGLSQSQHVLFPNTSHLVLEGECGQRIAIAFLNQPTSQADTSCVAAIPSIGFILHTTVTRFPIQIVAALLSIVAVFGLGQMAFYGLRGLKRTAWWASIRRMGIFPLLALLALLYLVLTKATILPQGMVSVGIIPSIIPLLMALQVAAVFNPSDEPSLEIQMAAPRSMMWMLAERVFVVVLTYSLIALVGIGVTLWQEPQQDLAVLLLGWLPPALFLSGMGLYVTVRSRMMALGVLLMGFLWFIFALFAPMFLPGQNFPAPFHLIQPFIWPLHVHASLADLTPQDFWLNRLFLGVGGIVFMILSAYSLRDSEELLMGVKAQRSSGKKVETEVKRELKPSLTLQPVQTSIEPLQQILGIIRYEFLMRWRTRAIKVFILAPLALTVVFMLMLGELSSLFPNLSGLDMMSTETQMLIKGDVLVVIASSIFFLPAIYMFPILVSDTIPSDKRWHIDDLMNALPTVNWVQLTGRVLGNVVAVVVSLLIALALMAVMWMLRFGSFNPLPILDYGLGMGIASAIMTAGAVLIGASQPSSRRAIFLAIGLIILPEFLLLNETIRQVLPARAGFVQLFSLRAMMAMVENPPAPHQMVSFSSEFSQLMAANLLFVLICSLIVWAFRRNNK